MNEPQPDQTSAPEPATGEAPDTGPDEQEHAPCLDVPLPAGLEALLLSTDRPLAEDRLADLLGIGGKDGAASVRAAITTASSVLASSAALSRSTMSLVSVSTLPGR